MKAAVIHGSGKVTYDLEIPVNLKNEKMMNNTNERLKIKVDYTQRYIPRHVRSSMPLVYKDGRNYYCILDEHTTNAIICEGRSALEAMENWEAEYEKQHSPSK